MNAGVNHLNAFPVNNHLLRPNSDEQVMSMGYNLDRFVDLSETDEQDYTCRICHDVLIGPVVTQCCKQMFCKICIEEWLKNSRTCPLDRKTMTISSLSEPPRVLLNKIGQLKIKCDYERRGCPDVVALEDLSKHLENCHFRDICDKCSNKSQEFIEQLIQSNEKSKQQIKQLEEERDNYLQTIQKLSQDLDAVDPIHGPPDKRVFKAWKQMTFGLEINEWQIILNARKYLAEREPIVTESHMNQEMSQTIVDFVIKQLKEQKSVFDICQNVVQKLDLDYGNSWQCLADYDDSSMAYFTYEQGHLIKLTFGCLQFKIFKAFNSDEENFINRFRKLDIKHDIEVKREENMNEKMVQFIKRSTFAAIDKFDTLSDILVDIQKRMDREYGGHWFCLGYSMGAFPLRTIKGYFIEFQLLDIKFTIFQIND